MTYSWHPWLAELALSAGNRVRRARQAPLQSASVLAVVAVLGALLWLALRLLDGDRVGVIIHLLIAQPLVLVALFGLFGYFGVHGTTLALATEWRYGWWGAMPVPDRIARRTLRLVALVFTLLMIAFVVGMLGVVAALSRHWETWFAAASGLSAIGLALGALIGFLTSRGTDAPERHKVHAISAAKPLFRLPMIDHTVLPHVGAWQRRDALRRWRHGGAKWPFLVIGLTTPSGMAPGTLIGLLMVGLSLVWFGMVLRTSADVAATLDKLLEATPRRYADYALATLRYPLWAWAVSSVFGALGLLLQEARWPFVVAYPVALLFVTALQMALAWRYRTRPVLGRWRLGGEVVLGIALFVLLGPLSLFVPALLLIRHLHAASRIR